MAGLAYSSLAIWHDIRGLHGEIMRPFVMGAVLISFSFRILNPRKKPLSQNPEILEHNWVLSSSYKMAPPSADIDTHLETSSSSVSPASPKARTIPEIKRSITGLTQSASFPTPLRYSGTLDNYESFNVTNVIGREFPKLQLSEILKDDAKIRDLAITGMWSLSNKGMISIESLLIVL